LTQVTYKRFADLRKVEPGAVSQLDLDKYKAQEEEAFAGKKLAEANLDTTKLFLEWTKVKSPIKGIASRFYLTLGNLVNADQTLLTTIVSMNPMYVYFDMDEATLLQIKRAVNAGKIIPTRVRSEAVIGAGAIGLLPAPAGPLLAATAALFPGRAGVAAPVLIGLAGEEGYKHEGTFNFIDNQVNPGTGSISVRGEFKNPKPGPTYLLVPGMFVRVRMQIGQPQDKLLVNDKAVISEQGKKLVYVIDADNKVEKRDVQLGQLQEDGFRVIERGLERDDWVLTGGLQQVQPGVVIRPDKTRPWEDAKK
jgi:multidrug efflux system membrane fusion protein